jgi:predicted ATPase
MQLISFSVSNFRSITKAKKVPLSSYSVLVGANNEGKSNILDALAIAMDALEQYKYTVRRDTLGRIIPSRQTVLGKRSRYNWDQDFPVSKRNLKSGDRFTQIILEFQLSDIETEEFRQRIGSNLNGTLPMCLQFMRDDYDISILKQGRGGPALTKKATKIADFISQKINFEYIPAIRTSKNAEDVIADLLSKELSKLEKQDDFRLAVEKIEALQAPILAELAASIKGTVASFLPSVQSVALSSTRDARYRALRQTVKIEIDDGNNTTLERKGDGVKSLVALALMRYASEKASATETTIVAIEEPEAHLHPQAIHELREVILSLSQKNQIVLTSHSPLFVNPANLKSTIIVRDSKADCAKNIAEVRDVLGVRMSDNLQSARLIAVVEGSDDIIILKAAIEHFYPLLRESIESGDLVFDDLGGASNLSYKVRTYRTSASMVHCFLDNDKSGLSAVKKALEDSVISTADYNLISMSTLNESELEDALNAQKYKLAFVEKFGVDPTVKLPAATGLKWSDRMAKIFPASGKIWDARQQMEAKLWLANYAAENIGDVFQEAHKGPFVAFAEALERKLTSPT